MSLNPFSSDEQYLFFGKVLDRYCENLCYLLENDEDIKKSTTALKKDIEENKNKVKELAELFRDQHARKLVVLQENKEIICSALNCYLKDLQNDKNILKEKIGTTKFNFGNIEEEEYITKSMLDKYCKEFLQ